MRSFLLAIALLTLWCPLVSGQASDEALKDRVAQLVDRLDAARPEARDSAEKALIGLGPRALPLLPEITKSTSEERKKRLERIKQALQDADADTNLGASKVTIKGQGIRLSEAVRQLQAQTGNPITDLREQMGIDVTNPGLDLDIADKPFFEALDIIAEKANIGLSFFTGDGSIGITGPSEMPSEGDTTGAGKPQFRLYSGPFRIVLKQIFASRSFLSGTGNANAQFEVAWEPRLRPMLISLKAEDLKIIDDQNKEVEPSVMQESTEVVLRPENPASELNINMEAPERSAKKLATFKFKGDVTVPAALRTFRFPSLTAKSVKQKQGDITVTLEDSEVDEQVWKVHVKIAYPQGGPAFESYRQGLFNNRLWLQKKDGSRFEHNGGFSNIGAAEGELGFEYLFVEAPGKPADYQFVYETPSKVVTIPLEFEFKDVPLP